MGNSASSLPYAIGKQQVACVNDGWALHEGSRKSDGATVSVFLAKKPVLLKTPVHPRQPNLTQYETALHHFQQCKKLRHPHILQVHATLDTDHPNESSATATAIGNPSNTTASNTGDFIIVTEPCVSLDTWLQQQQSPPPEQIAWGLESIIRALHFLHASAGLVHGNLSPTSFYVTPAGDVKLWNFALVSSFTTSSSSAAAVPRHFIDWESLITPQEYRSPERIEGRWDAIATAGVHAMDSYGLGVLMGHLFRAQGGGVPPALQKAVQRLLTANLKMRPRLQPLLKCPVFDTPYQKLQLQLEELAVQPAEQKIQFWHNLTPNLQAEVIPEPVAVHTLLPLMKANIETICLNESLRAQEVFRKEVLSMLAPLFYIAENFLDTSTVGKSLGTIIGILFRVNDRAIRGTLLQKAPFMASSFDPNVLNEAVFEPMCSGFSDSSAALRELTLKSTAALVPHLTQPNLEKLCRYLVRLQQDQETSIRTNTVIFFSKIAPYLTETTRQKMLLPAFVRAMKDLFTPCRLAALKSTLKAKEFFNPSGVATRVMPAVTPLLVDPSAEVRREAFMAVDDLLFVLRQESERLNKLPEPQQQQQPAMNGAAAASVSHVRSASAGGAVAAASAKTDTAPKSGGGFSLGGLSSWMTSKATAPDAPTPATAPTAVSHAPPPRTAAPHPPPYVPAAAPTAAAMSAMHLNANNSNDWGDDDDDEGLDDGDGWDDDLDMSGNGGARAVTNSSSAAPAVRIGATAAPVAVKSSPLFAAAAADEDDFFGTFDAKPAKPVVLRKMGGGATTGKLMVPSSKGAKLAVKPAVKKLSASEDVADGWDDF